MTRRYMRHTVDKATLLRYALEGARMQRGTMTFEDDTNDEAAALLDKDIREIQRRIKLVEAQQRRAIEHERRVSEYRAQREAEGKGE